MTPRQRILAAVRHRQPDRVPITLAFAPEVEAALRRRLGVDPKGFRDWCGEDITRVAPAFRSAASDRHYADPTIEVTPDGLYLDIWRVPFRAIDAGEQTYVEQAGRPPLAACRTAADLDEHPWPRAEWWDYSTIPPAMDAAGPAAATLGHSRGFFEISHFLRGMDNFLADLAIDPDFACALMDHVIDYLLDRARRCLEAAGGRYTIFEYNDDVASQRSLFISPAMWRDLIKPRMKRFCDLYHAHGAVVRYHCCGSCREIVEDLIQIGVDILNPTQPLAAGMDPFELKRVYGDRITFDGGIDIQDLLPHATPAAVRAHTRRMIETVGRDGGYILGPSHAIQSDCPPENIIAMIDEANGR